MMFRGRFRPITVFVAAVLGCAPPQPPDPAVVPLPTPGPDPVVAPAPIAPFRLPTPYTGQLRFGLRTTAIATDSARTDSAVANTELLVSRLDSMVLVVVVRADTASVVDSLPRIRIDATGRWGSPLLPSACRETPLPSPLMVRLLMSRVADSWPARDSLHYTTCSGRALRQLRVSVQWLEPRPADDRSNYEQRVLLTGTIAGDSTRAFPMRTLGTVHGEARMRVSATSGQVLDASGVVTVEVDAMANAMRQRARQRVTFSAQPRP
jgi:hypothetical protein